MQVHVRDEPVQDPARTRIRIHIRIRIRISSDLAKGVQA